MIATAYEGPLQLRLDWIPPSPETIATWRCEQAEERVARLQRELQAAQEEMVAATRHWVEVRYGGAR